MAPVESDVVAVTHLFPTVEAIRDAPDAVFAMPAAFVMTILVSLLTPKPSADVQNFVADLRRRD